MENIAAIATPPGYGGLAVLRLSGPEALEIGRRCFRPQRQKELCVQDDRRLIFGTLIDGQQALDQAVAALFIGPRSYTGETVLEFSCHGSPWLAQRGLQALLHAGARLAEPGEFTRRAFENGKIDLIQAEAVLDLIHSHGAQSAELALSQLSGRLSEKIRKLEGNTRSLIAELQAELEFPDEDLTFEPPSHLMSQTRALSEGLNALVQTYEEGRILQHGFSCALVGPVNAGKSTLANALLGQEKSIVSNLPGTTRDIVESRVQIEGHAVQLFDTAGLRESDDQIEQEGIRRSQKALEDADLVLLVWDSSASITPEQEEMFRRLAKERRAFLLLWNKVDLPSSAPLPEPWLSKGIPVSAQEIQGLETLKKRMLQELLPLQVSSGERLLLSNVRQRDSLAKALTFVRRAGETLSEQRGSELAVEDFRDALRQLGRVLGEVTPDDILDIVFSRFCIGK